MLKLYWVRVRVSVRVMHDAGGRRIRQQQQLHTNSLVLEIHINLSVLIIISLLII